MLTSPLMHLGIYLRNSGYKQRDQRIGKYQVFLALTVDFMTEICN